MDMSNSKHKMRISRKKRNEDYQGYAWKWLKSGDVKMKSSINYMLT